MKRKLLQILIYALYVIFSIPYMLGLIVWYITRPILSLSHLLMFNVNTAKRIISEWTVYKDISDI